MAPKKAAAKQPSASAKAAAAAALKDDVDPKDQATKDAGAAHLADLAAQPGWHALSSGVLFRITALGRVHTDQLSPTQYSEVSVQYTGRLIDGRKFDSTADRGAALVCRPSQVIRGWGEALTLMGEGDAWDIAVPWHQAYGKEGAAKEAAVPIPPYSALLFSLQLVTVTRPAPGAVAKKGERVPEPGRPAAEARAELAENVGKPYESLFVPPDAAAA